MVRIGGSGQALFERIACGSTARGDLDFPVDSLQVGVDRARTDDELCGDLGVSQSLSQQAQHLYFAHRQPVRIGGWQFRRWSWVCLSWDRHGSSICKGLLPCHATSPGPCCRKGLLTQLGTRVSNIHAGQSSQQALFIRLARCRVVTLHGENLCEKRARRGEHSLIIDLLPKRVALFNQPARGRRLPLSEGDLPLESERKSFGTRGARFRSARETLLC